MCHSGDWQREAKAREAHKQRTGIINDLRTNAEKQAGVEKRVETAKKSAREPVPAK